MPSSGLPTGSDAPVERRNGSRAATDLAETQPIDTPGTAVSIRDLRAWHASRLVIEISALELPQRRITAIIGPSGSGKSTLLRCMNRMHETVLGARVTGNVVIADQDVYGPRANPMLVRRHIGMVFQRPNPLPTRSIYENVALGPRLLGTKGRRLDELVERCLRQAFLWDEVKDRLKVSPAQLSGGQQQRLCIARTLAMKPSLILMDEPASALDPLATYQIEEVMAQLRNELTIVIVTHNLQQASRASDFTAFLLAGDDRVGHLIEYAPTAELFSRPRDQRTEEYLQGRYG